MKQNKTITVGVTEADQSKTVRSPAKAQNIVIMVAFGQDHQIGSVDNYLSGTAEYVPIHTTLAELRNYTGNATRCVVHYNGTTGIAVRDDSIVI